MDITITIDDNEPFQKEALIMAIMNGRYYGGGFNPTPEASINDNLLDYCTIDNLSKLRLMKLLPAYTKGTHIGAKEVSCGKFENLHISSPVELTMEADGETFYGTEVNVKVLKNYLTLKLPNKINI
jgi:diacylglycerol kinase family enzyme